MTDPPEQPPLIRYRSVTYTAANTARFVAWALVVASLVPGGCSSPDADPGSDEDDAFPDHSDLIVEPLIGQRLSQAPAIAKPWQIQVSGSKLWVVDAAGDPGLHMLDAESGELVRSLGRKGDGPGEFKAGPWDVDPVSGSHDGVWALDRGHQRMTLFDSRTLPANELQMLRLQGPTTIANTTWLRSDLIVGVTATEQERIVLMDADGRRLRTVAAPFLGPADISYQERQQASATGFRLCAQPPARGFVIVYYTASVIEHYDSTGYLVRRMDVPFPSEPVFERTESGEASFRYDRDHYLDCTSTDERLYALYSGRHIARGEIAAADYVHVFDWQGAFHGAYRLDWPVRGISIDPEGRYIYAVSLLDAGVYRFPVPRRDPR
jgi:hypothetical protein